METKDLGLLVLLIAGSLTIAGCNNTDTPIEGGTQLANPASVYCEQQGGTLQIETAGDGSQYGICMFSDGTYCEERSYYRNECQAGEIFYNTISGDVIPEATTSYSNEDITAAEAAIVNVVQNEWDVKIESFNISYAGDKTSSQNLRYCQSLKPEVEECIVFISNFHIPEQDAEMAGGFEPNTDVNGYEWYLGRSTAGEWEILTNGFG